MKINVFRTQAKIGSMVRYKGKVYILADLDKMYRSRTINTVKI